MLLLILLHFSSTRSNSISLSPKPMPRPSTTSLLALSLVIQLGLLAYSAHVDAHPEAFGGLKYTDVDWRVVYDGLSITANPGAGQHAEGLLAPPTLGSPYHRATFRYTPLLVLFLSPGLVHEQLGRLTLVAMTLAVPPVLLAAGASFWHTHLLWTLNPIVLNISTRGSPEALPCLLTALLILSLRRAGLGSTLGSTASPSRKWEAISAVLLSIATSYKIYPAIYVPSIWLSLAHNHGVLSPRVWRFGFIAAATALLLNTALYLLWGEPFLHHTFLYHLTRQDHRHNFSPYFLQIYHTLTSPASCVLPPLSTLLPLLRHPLTSFLPQASIVLLAAFLTPAIGLEAAMFFQTALFVVFNKVCTSQYFLWPLPFVPFLKMPNLSWTVLGVSLAAWIAAQAVWLGYAYRLEFTAEDVYFPLWGAGLALFLVSCAGIGALLDGTGPGPRPAPTHKS